MLTPRYFFANDFKQFYSYFLTQPHKKRFFRKGEFLWESGEPFQRIHYIISGAAQNYMEHENGHRKIISFHGEGTVFPGYHQHDYKIEQSLITTAVSDMNVLEFTKEQFRQMFETNPQLSANIVDWYSTYVNRLLYETAHQEYNSSLTRLCNLLYLLTGNETDHPDLYIDMRQDDLSDLLGISRIHVTRGLSQLREQEIILTRRKQIEIMDLPALTEYCSLETL